MNRLLLATTVLAALLAVGNSLTDQQKNQLNDQVNKVNTLLGLLKTNDFTAAGLLDSIAKLLPDWMSPIGTIISLFKKGGDNTVLTMIQQQLKVINSKLDGVLSQLKDLTTLQEWSRVTIPLIQYENNIAAVRRRYDAFVENARSSSKNIYLRDFLRSYEQAMQESTIKLFNAFVNDKWVFDQNLGAAAQKLTKNDRARLRKFLAGLLGLIMRGIEMELCYKENKFGTNDKNEAIKLWKKYMNLYSDKMKEADGKVKREFGSQQVEDVKELAQKSSGKSHRDFVTLAYRALSRKYFWRDWMVLAFRKISSSYKKFAGCYQHFVELYDVGGRDIAFGSVERSLSTFKKSFGDLALARVNENKHDRPNGNLWEPEVRNAIGGCKSGKFWGAVYLDPYYKEKVEVIAKDNRYSTRVINVFREIGDYFFTYKMNLYVFG